MSQDFRPLGGNESPLNPSRGSWAQMDMDSSTDSIGVELNREPNSTDVKVEKVVTALPEFVRDCPEMTRFLVDSVELTLRKRVNREGLITDFPLDIEDVFVPEVLAKGILKEADYYELYCETLPLPPGNGKDEKLEQVITGLLKGEFIAKDKEAIKRLPIESRSYNIFSVIMNYNALKKERFDLLYEALDQIFSEDKRAELRRMIRAVENEYSLA